MEIIDLRCQYCGSRCFLPVFETWLHGPASLLAAGAFISRRVGLVATCKRGRAVERDLMGVEYDASLSVAQREAVSSLVSAQPEATPSPR